MATKTPHVLVVRLMDIQKSLGLTGSEMARRLHVNPSTWMRLTEGDIQPTLRIVQETVASFPELRSLCVELLLIRSRYQADQQNASEQVPA